MILLILILLAYLLPIPALAVLNQHSRINENPKWEWSLFLWPVLTLLVAVLYLFAMPVGWFLGKVAKAHGR